MLWTEVKKWAKSNGYEVLKDTDNGKVQYYWSKIDNPENSGVSGSLSKLAKDIYNLITDNIWIEHQTNYINIKNESQH